jgi:hypothetical protein
VSGGVSSLIRTKIEKARQFLDMAELAGDAYFDAAASLAVSAAINASDALSVLAKGSYLTGDNHDEAAVWLRKAGFQTASKHLARALAYKSKAQYSAARCTEKDAADAIKHARRLLDEAVGAASSKGHLSD